MLIYLTDLNLYSKKNNPNLIINSSRKKINTSIICFSLIYFFSQGPKG